MVLRKGTGGGGAFPAFLALPCGELFVGAPRVFAVNRIGCGNRGRGQFETNAIGVEEVDRLDEMMVGGTENVNSAGDETLTRVLEFIQRADPQRKMVNPSGRIRRRIGFLVI